jgi:hypothetical protein
MSSASLRISSARPRQCSGSLIMDDDIWARLQSSLAAPYLAVRFVLNCLRSRLIPSASRNGASASHSAFRTAFEPPKVAVGDMSQRNVVTDVPAN